MIVYNSPEHAKERQNVTPPSVEEMQELVSDMEYAIDDAFLEERFTQVNNLFQRLIWHYENLNHFYTLVGGWGGLDKLQKANEWISVDDALPENIDWVLAKYGDEVQIYPHWYRKQNSAWYCLNEANRKNELITHWKNFPKP